MKIRTAILFGMILMLITVTVTLVVINPQKREYDAFDLGMKSIVDECDSQGFFYNHSVDLAHKYSCSKTTP